MSDDPAPEETEAPAAPKAPGARGTRPTGKRLSTTGGLVVGPSEDEQRRFRRRLLLGIVFAIVGLSIALVIKMFGGALFGHKSQEINPAKESEAAFDAAKAARLKIDKIEQKVYQDAGTLEASDYKEIKDQNATIIDSVGKLMYLLDLISHLKDGVSSQEYREILLKTFQAKVWLNDAGEVVDSEKDKTPNPGFYMPMEVAMRNWKKANEEFQTVVKNQADLLKDTEQKKNTAAQLEALSKVFTECNETFSMLDDRVQKWLAVEVSAKEVPELGPLREEQVLLGQALKTMRETRGEFKE